MTDERMALVELLQKSGDGDFRRDAASLARLHRPGGLTAVWVPDADLKGLITKMHVSRGEALEPYEDGPCRRSADRRRSAAAKRRLRPDHEPVPGSAGSQRVAEGVDQGVDRQAASARPKTSSRW